MTLGSTRDHSDDEDRQVHKRPRYSSEDEENEVEVIVEEGSTTDRTPSIIEYNETSLPVDDQDGFVEGSIVKITLTNFVTYDYCEVFPGPQMNMIIGPNGTGKSTIVCAIALGLGGSPNLLGRAKNIQEFVKTGEDEATIAIELKKVNERNVVIQRSFKKSSNSTSWKVNGKSTTYKDVMSLIHSFSIQVDNLCQFLPQDRVAEFAELTPSQLLEKTQSAAGEMRLYEMQKKLTDWREIQKNLQRSHTSDLDHINTLKARNKDLERDVFRMQLKQKIVDEIKLLKAQEPLVRYAAARKQLELLSDLVNQQKQAVQKFQADHAPLQDILKGYENDLRKILVEKNKETETQKRKIQALKENLVQVQTIRGKIHGCKSDVGIIEKKIPEKQQKMKILQRKIKEFEENLSNPPDADTSAIEASITRVNEKMNEQRFANNEITEKARSFAKNKREQQVEGELKKKKLEDMKNILNIRLQQLQRFHPDTVKAFEWLKQNRDKFSGRVYNPVLLEINLKDSRYASHIEQVLGGHRSNTFRTFLFEKQEDYLEFTRIAIDQHGWKLTAAWPDRLREDVTRTPTSTEELRQKFKFEHYMVDLIQAPEFVLKYLCMETKINLIPVSLQPINEEPVVNSGVFQKFTSAQSFYNVKPNRYSKGSYQTEVNLLRPAQLLNDSIDNEVKKALIDGIRMHQTNIQQCEQDMKELTKEADGIKQTLRELEAEKSDLQSQKRDIQIAVQQYERSKRRLEQTITELEQLQTEPEEDRAKIKEIKEEIERLLDDEAEKLNLFTDHSHDMVESYKRTSRLQLESVETTVRYEAVKAYIHSQAGALEEAQKVLAGYKLEHDNLANRVKSYMKQARDAGRELTAELKESFKDIVNRFREGDEMAFESVEELELKIAEKEGEAAAIDFANPNAMKHYEARVQEIDRLKAKIEDDKEKMSEIENKIADLRSQWEPRIDGLIGRINEKFSEAFRRIGCAGEIAIDKQEDFDKWGVQIRVKFRDTEKLQILTGQRQSGGERSVSTILYLMSLQNLAKSPFRVVDEINQGMDPKNERMIHEQIVQGASRSGTSQYFLITPKLLPDLYYNEKIRVLCIYNGEWVPTKMDPLTKYLKHARQYPECAV
ncbi:hypothetical protein G6F57_000086 [Rhizopus arrhizus]|uniref:Structural maintenance of chromosomes protein 5 n=1 Tax=Rhizopus oryzae TaxID=64495 RepID=A0A9P6XKU5_RHIOR|nr:hypothetical protein G6F24_002340 [Rhizopus arrhizus]KAG1429393.1 hypothetical protein G6F58_000057 [Rhizopus delemar]KAG0797911.1 hypothetical protein G6F21_000144 [Rhizopus arrhizus]KAG0798656.1 hypothetical protein G6F22_004006 [Rhizopus arrhizus]KAG0820079.1 hypothetical protein G6F20_000238 [Rhizopus arrhizus]